MEPTYRLSELELDEISLVPSGDDGEARMVLAKREPDKYRDRTGSSSTVTHQAGNGEGMEPKNTISKDELPDEVVEYIETLEDAVDTLSEEVDTLKADDDDDADTKGRETTATVDDDDDDDLEIDITDLDDLDLEPDEEAELALAKADPTVRRYITKMEQRRQADRTRLAKAEETATKTARELERRDFVSKASALPFIGKADELGGLMQSLYEKAPEEAAVVEKILTKLNGQVESSAIFDEIGKLGKDSDPNGEFATKVSDIKKADPSLTDQQARAQVLDANPSLYDEYLKES